MCGGEPQYKQQWFSLSSVSSCNVETRLNSVTVQSRFWTLNTSQCDLEFLETPSSWWCLWNTELEYRASHLSSQCRSSKTHGNPSCGWGPKSLIPALGDRDRWISMSSRPAGTTWRNPVLKNKKRKRKKFQLSSPSTSSCSIKCSAEGIHCRSQDPE